MITRLATPQPFRELVECLCFVCIVDLKEMTKSLQNSRRLSLQSNVLNMTILGARSASEKGVLRTFGLECVATQHCLAVVAFQVFVLENIRASIKAIQEFKQGLLLFSLIRRKTAVIQGAHDKAS